MQRTFRRKKQQQQQEEGVSNDTRHPLPLSSSPSSSSKQHHDHRQSGAASNNRRHDSAALLCYGAVLLWSIWISLQYSIERVHRISQTNLDGSDHTRQIIMIRDNSNSFNDIVHTTDKSHDYPYTNTALAINPHLGWQPQPHTILNTPNISFHVMTCFQVRPNYDGADQPPGCNENPSEIENAPSVGNSWVPDVTMIRKMLVHGKDRNDNIFPPALSKEYCGNFTGPWGLPGEDMNKECIERSLIRSTGALNSTTVTINPYNHYSDETTHDLGSSPNSTSITLPAPKILCLVYTMEKAHATRVRAMRETWAGGCDGFIAFSTTSDPRFPIISIEHEGGEAYGNMWQKVRSMWKFVGRHYLEDFDWFIMGGDDWFLLPHNLKTYLASLTYRDRTDPRNDEYYVGRRLCGGDVCYNSGGAGYTLSRATLRMFLTVVDTPECFANERTSKEDVMMARCLQNHNISLIDTRDSRGRERFHYFEPGTLFKLPSGKPFEMYRKFNRDWGVLDGKDCCAPDSVSFHYIRKGAMMRHLQAMLYSC